MMRFLRYSVAAIIGIALAAIALILEGETLETIIFGIKDVPVIDFATLERRAAPNQFLLCPTSLCSTRTDGAAPVFNVTVPKLQAEWDAMIAEQPRVQVLRRDLTNMQIDYVQRSRFLRFPDLITVRFLPVDDTHSTLAIYSRSLYGKGDFGVNRARVEEWLARLKARLG
ncbi:DUF1499 domain-containing protein [Dongia deserti]|uniref:DUF1499 domain-containing protein n=1 Tax=Dongia deserti TaxID=2268030 RepID=UPI000E646D8E|nr:DUF1499 domain-containing protein [Dongia deserti]